MRGERWGFEHLGIIYPGSHQAAPLPILLPCLHNRWLHTSPTEMVTLPEDPALFQATSYLSFGPNPLVVCARMMHTAHPVGLNGGRPVLFPQRKCKAKDTPRGSLSLSFTVQFKRRVIIPTQKGRGSVLKCRLARLGNEHWMARSLAEEVGRR